MREEIRLGNEALERSDFETARQHYQQLLAAGGTDLQVRIAENRLRDIQDQLDALQNPTPAKKRASRKAAAKKASNEEPPHKVVRPPEKPIVEIRKH